MKITGPGSGAPPQGPGAADEAKGPAGKGFADELHKTDNAAGISRASETGAPTGATPSGATNVRDIGADLSAGRITPQAALDKVIDRVVSKQVGANAPAAVREKVEAALRQAIEDDPMLAEKVRGLGA